MNTLAGLTGPIPRGEVEVARNQGQLVPLLGADTVERGDCALLGPEGEHQRIDALEEAMLRAVAAGEVEVRHLPVEHRMLPGLYVRTIFMPAGSRLTSKCHITDHVFVVHSGSALVLIPDAPPVRVAGGHLGITKAGTRRVLVIETDCLWSTFHVLSPEEEQMRQNGATIEAIVEAIEKRIIGWRPGGAEAHAAYRDLLDCAGLPSPHQGAQPLPNPLEKLDRIVQAAKPGPVCFKYGPRMKGKV